MKWKPIRANEVISSTASEYVTSKLTAVEQYLLPRLERLVAYFYFRDMTKHGTPAFISVGSSFRRGSRLGSGDPD